MRKSLTSAFWKLNGCVWMGFGWVLDGFGGVWDEFLEVLEVSGGFRGVLAVLRFLDGSWGSFCSALEFRLDHAFLSSHWDGLQEFLGLPFEFS